MSLHIANYPSGLTFPKSKACDHLLLPDIEAVRVLPHYLISLPDDRADIWYDSDHPKTRFVICCYTIVYQLFQMGMP